MRQLLECGAHGILVEDGLRTYESFTGKLPIEALTPSFLVFSGAFRKSRLQLGVAARARVSSRRCVGLLRDRPSDGRSSRSPSSSTRAARSSSSTSGPA